MVNGKLKRIVADMIKEPLGGYSVINRTLPGASTHGETLSECQYNFNECVDGVIECYLEDGKEIPWVN